MADLITLDVAQMQEMSLRLRRIGQDLSDAGSEALRCVSDIRGAVPRWESLISQMQRQQQAVKESAERADRYSKTILRVTAMMEETEKKLAGQAASVENTETRSHGGAGHSFGIKGVEQGDWVSGFQDWLRENVETLRNNNDYFKITSSISKMWIAVLLRQEYSSGHLHEYTFNPVVGPSGSYRDIDYALQGWTKESVWNNDYISVTKQKFNIFGFEFETYAPYINYGTGASVDVLAGKGSISNPLDPEIYESLEGTAGSLYVGRKFEAGFKDGKFVFHLTGGASAEAVSGSATLGGPYWAIKAGTGLGEGAKVSFDIEDGVISVDGIVAPGTKIQLGFSYDAGKVIDDSMKCIDSLVHGDFLTFNEKKFDLIWGNNPVMRGMIPNPYRVLRDAPGRAVGVLQDIWPF